jgi:hypothetical protein
LIVSSHRRLFVSPMDLLAEVRTAEGLQKYTTRIVRQHHTVRTYARLLHHIEHRSCVELMPGERWADLHASLGDALIHRTSDMLASNRGQELLVTQEVLRQQSIRSLMPPSTSASRR